MTGLVALAFVALGVVFSLVLPDTRHREEVVVVEPAPAGSDPGAVPTAAG